MDKHFDIYITFPDGLAESNKELSATIESYISHLSEIVERVILRKPAIIVKEKDFNKGNYKNSFEVSSSFVFFTHPVFESNEGYERELADLCGFLQLDHADTLKGNPQIFRICLEPNKNALKPDCIENLASYIFYDKGTFSRKIKNLEFGLNKNNLNLYGKLFDLAYDISGSLTDHQGKKTKRSETKGYVYLGLTNIDQMESRDDIRRELQQLGYKILPMESMPTNEEDFKIALLKYLEISDSVIQLMGTQYGDIPKGFKNSIPDLQNRVIKEYKAHDHTQQPKYLIWLPAGKIINDQRQSLYLRRIKHEDATQNTEIIETSLESFKTLVVNRLKIARESKKVDYGNIFQVYLITEETPSKEIDRLYSCLSSSGLKVLTLDYSEQVGIYARHLQKLRDCDSVIVYQQENNPYWLDSKIKDLVKSPGIGRIKPFNKIVIVAKNKPNEQLMGMIKSKIDIISDTKYDDDLILQKLIAE